VHRCVSSVACGVARHAFPSPCFRGLQTPLLLLRELHCSRAYPVLAMFLVYRCVHRSGTQHQLAEHVTDSLRLTTMSMHAEVCVPPTPWRCKCHWRDVPPLATGHHQWQQLEPWMDCRLLDVPSTHCCTLKEIQKHANLSQQSYCNWLEAALHECSQQIEKLLKSKASSMSPSRTLSRAVSVEWCARYADWRSRSKLLSLR